MPVLHNTLVDFSEEEYINQTKMRTGTVTLLLQNDKLKPNFNAIAAKMSPKNP
jgi:hypothetical protein